MAARPTLINFNFFGRTCPDNDGLLLAAIDLEGSRLSRSGRPVSFRCPAWLIVEAAGLKEAKALDNRADASLA